MICTIPKGSHYCTGYSLGSMHTGITSMEFDVIFEESCLVAPTQWDCLTDWNKLFGFSYGYHHSNSLRLVWRVQDNRIRIGWYNYQSGKVTSKGFATVNVKELNRMKIDHDYQNGIVYYTCADKYVGVPYTKSPTWGYRLKPYHGGNCPAQETMKIILL